MLGRSRPAQNARKDAVPQSILPLVNPDTCEALIREVNASIAGAYSEANTIARRTDVLQSPSNGAEPSSACAATSPSVTSDGSKASPGWGRFTIGWHALEEGTEWLDAQPFHTLRFQNAIEIYEADRSEGRGEHLAEELARATFPFET